MDTRLEGRLALIQRINELWYEGSAWLKAVSLVDLRKQLNPADQHLLDSVRETAEPGLDQRRALIRLFLRGWLIWHLPEHIGTWGRDANDFQPVSAEQATALADEIMRACLEEKPVEILPGDYADWVPRVLERMPWYRSGEDAPPGVEDWDDPGDVAIIPYSQLRDWFPDHLFDPASASFFANTRSHVLAMDRDLIAMLWLESSW